MEIDDRTNPMGLFNYAHSYWASAVALQNANPDCTHKEAPVDYLYFHAVELYLKSFLRLRGFKLEKLKRNVGHSIAKAHAAAVDEGLDDDDDTRRVVKLIDTNYMRSRYIQTGPFEVASPIDLWGVCYVLHDIVEPQINASRGVARKRKIPYYTEDVMN